jgi:glycosyltransferase involved in cell wall biosynthesis
MSKPLRVLLLNHGRASELMGGDGVQIAATAEGLRRRGHQVRVALSNQPDTSDVDLVHIFNARTDLALAGQMMAARQASLPIVVSPIWISLNQARWGSIAARAVLEKFQHDPATGERLLDQLISRRLIVKCNDELIHFAQSGDALATKLTRIASLLEDVDALLPNSWLELAALRRDLAWRGTLVDVATYGVDPRIFSKPDPEPFRRLSGLNGPFVLQAGRVEPPKNPAMLLHALRHSDLPVVLAGRNDLDPAYTELCRMIGGDRLQLHGHLSPDLLASAYAAAAVHVLPSWCETCGLVTLEAALAGTPVVVSIAGHEAAYVGADAWYCDPADPMSIRQAVEAAMKAGPTDRRVSRLQRRILSEFNWDAMVEVTERIYMSTLTFRRR